MCLYPGLVLLSEVIITSLGCFRHIGAYEEYHNNNNNIIIRLIKARLVQSYMIIKHYIIPT